MVSPTHGPVLSLYGTFATDRDDPSIVVSVVQDGSVRDDRRWTVGHEDGRRSGLLSHPLRVSESGRGIDHYVVGGTVSELRPASHRSGR